MYIVEPEYAIVPSDGALPTIVALVPSALAVYEVNTQSAGFVKLPVFRAVSPVPVKVRVKAPTPPLEGDVLAITGTTLATWKITLELYEIVPSVTLVFAVNVTLVCAEVTAATFVTCKASVLLTRSEAVITSTYCPLMVIVTVSPASSFSIFAGDTLLMVATTSECCAITLRPYWSTQLYGCSPVPVSVIIAVVSS